MGLQDAGVVTCPHSRIAITPCGLPMSEYQYYEFRTVDRTISASSLTFSADQAATASR